MKKPEHLKNSIFIIYSPRTITVETVTCNKIDTNITLILPKKAKAFVISKFRGEKIYEINSETQRLWIEILNKSYQEELKIRRNTALGFLIIEPSNLQHKHETQSTKKKKILPKTWSEWTKNKGEGF